MLDPQIIKKDFPIFEHHPELVYLDSAATAQKPRVVLEAMRQYYEEFNANVSRGLYPMAEMTTAAVEAARNSIAHFIGSETKQTLFVGSATHGINLVATGLRERLKAGENIVVTAIEHHSNFLPWKELAEKTGAEFRVAKVDTTGTLSPENILAQIDTETRVLALTAVSNVLGLVNPVRAIIATVREKNPNTLILVDAAQAVGHIPVSIRDWDVDYLVFSGHKTFGPTGIGVLAGKQQSLELLGAVNVGGGTVLDPTCSPVEYKALPESLEGGTPNIAGIIGLGAAMRYIETLGLELIHSHEEQWLHLLETRLKETFGEKVTLLGGTTKNRARLDEPRAIRAGILSFTLEGIHPHDLAQLLGEAGICIRAGEHCAKPLHQSLGVNTSARVSVSIYNTESDIEKFVTAMQKNVQLFKI